MDAGPVWHRHRGCRPLFTHQCRALGGFGVADPGGFSVPPRRSATGLTVRVIQSRPLSSSPRWWKNIRPSRPGALMPLPALCHFPILGGLQRGVDQHPVEQFLEHQLHIQHAYQLVLLLPGADPGPADGGPLWPSKSDRQGRGPDGLLHRSSLRCCSWRCSSIPHWSGDPPPLASAPGRLLTLLLL